MSIQSINPTTEEIIQTFEPYSEAQVNEALGQVRNTFLNWREVSFAERSTHLHRVASYMREHKAELAQFSTLEMGKPIVEAEAEIEKCAWACDFYADNAELGTPSWEGKTSGSPRLFVLHPLIPRRLDADAETQRSTSIVSLTLTD